MAQPEQANSRESGLHDRAEIRQAFERLVSEHRESLHEEDQRAILKTVEGDFDLGKARTLLETLPKNLADGKKRYEDLKKAYGDAEYGPLLREKFGEMSQMTFQKKVEAEEAISRAKKIDKQMKEWEIAGIIAPANRRFKLKHFLGLPKAEQEKIQNSLAGTLNIEERKHTLDRFMKLPESLRNEHYKNFRESSEEQRQIMLEKLEKEIAEKREKYIAAYRKKIKDKQDLDEHGLSLFSTRRGSGSSFDLYIKWFEALPVVGEKSMETYLAHSDLDNRERGDKRDEMVKLLNTVTDPKKRTALQREFNEADLEKRKEILARGIPKDEKPADPSLLARGKDWIKGKLQNLHLLPKSEKTAEDVQTYAILGEVAERRHRAELRYHRLSREGLQEATSQVGGDTAKKVAHERELNLKEDLLRRSRDDRANIARLLKPDLGREDTINTKARLVTKEGREVTSTDEFRHTVLARMEEDVREDLGENILKEAAREHVMLDEKQVTEAMRGKDLKQLGKETLRHAA